MAEGSILSDDLKRAIGLETEPTVIEVDKSMIKRFAESVGDSNPLWQDEASAERGPFGGLIAPPSLLLSVVCGGRSPLDPIANLLPPRPLDGGGEWEFYQPVRLGDRITVVNRLGNIVERPGRHGPMLLLTREATWRNQRGELVAKATTTTIRY